MAQEDANIKLNAILMDLRKTIKLEDGVTADVVFVRTPNTVTLCSSAPRRKIQIICRLYASVSDILNGFDIDCCCVGYDGQDVLLTPRAALAIRTKVNVVNLQIRGEAYENRLLKYAERAFAIGIPQLKENAHKIDRDHIEIQVDEECDVWDSMDGDAWSTWAESTYLERLLIAEHLGKKLGVIGKARIFFHSLHNQ